ncbi:putative glutamine transport system permease protein [Thermoactinomyces sp. DSM 45891]|uniref:amino acid ABC transporter permease n=1 Tax=Thermoactinomyces sp. DSM 45891 TaxID=1761907 RepID=UPI00091C3EAF|nr:amino acid ABC transporter permease [Thermoactinomyces sp. DSM 45891]SFX19239.1 putative glutamine transport system permease protein [Thermoactinomyces sp. DSM 45891]
MDFSKLLEGNTWEILLKGLWVTLEVAVVAIILSFIIGIILGILRYSKLPVLSQLATLYIEIVRNIPLLVIIFFAFNTLLDKFDSLVMIVIFGMTVFTSALIAEIVRSGLNSVPIGQIEAARAQGMSYVQTLIHIILPQALKRMIPPLVGQFVTLIKDTSLAAAITLPELLHEAKLIYSNPSYVNATIPILLAVAVIYFIVNYSLSLLSRRLEKKLAG